MNILFLCTGNSCRSQMAEGWAKQLKESSHNFFSAGTKKHGLNPRAIKVMQEVGVDISQHTSNTTDENCPYYAGEKIVHIGFDDPPRLTVEMIDEDEILKVYRRVIDEIKQFIEKVEDYL